MASVRSGVHSSAIPRIVVGMTHPMACHYVCDLINQHCRCWTATSTPGPGLIDLVESLGPDIVVAELDTDGVHHLAASGARCIVAVDRRNDQAYRAEMIAAGAEVWIARDRLDMDLTSALQATRGPFVRGSEC